MSLLRDHVRRLQERLEFIEDSRIFQDPDPPNSYDSTHISHQAHITSSSSKSSRESRTPRIAWADMSISGDVSDCQPARMWSWWSTRQFKEFCKIIGKSEKRRNWKTWKWRTRTSEQRIARKRRTLCEVAKLLDDFITPKSITGKNFPNYEELDLMMAAALKRCYDKQTHVRKKISVEEQRAQKGIRFLRGRHVAFLIYEYCRPTGSFDEIQG